MMDTTQEERRQDKIQNQAQDRMQEQVQEEAQGQIRNPIQNQMQERIRDQIQGRKESAMRKISGKILEYLTDLYLVFVIAALPLYNRLDYQKIGSDKVRFFMQATGIFLCFLIPAVLVRAAACGFSRLKLRGRGQKEESFRIKISRRFSVTDCFVLLYAFAVTVSALFSAYPDTAWMGSSRWGLGWYTQMVFVGSYFLISRCFRWKGGMVSLFLPVTSLLFFLGYCNRFGWYPVPMKTAGNPQFISFIGNINWYCGYMILPIFAAAFYVVGMDTPVSEHREENDNSKDRRGSKSSRKLWMWHLYLFLAFAALVTNGSSSAYLALAAGGILLLFIAVRKPERMQALCGIAGDFLAACLFTFLLRTCLPGRFTYEEAAVNLFTFSYLPFFLLLPVLILQILLIVWKKKAYYPLRFLRGVCRILALGLFLAAVFFVLLIVKNTKDPGSIGFLSKYPVFTFSKEWGSRRGVTWMAGLQAFAEQGFFRKLFGVGSDSMGEYIAQDASQKLQDLVYSVWPKEKNVRLTNAHNEWITLLVQTGLLGFLGFAGAQISAIIRWMKGFLRREELLYTAACAAAILVYLVHNMVSFQQILNGSAMFVILGLGENLLHSKNIK